MKLNANESIRYFGNCSIDRVVFEDRCLSQGLVAEANVSADTSITNTYMYINIISITLKQEKRHRKKLSGTHISILMQTYSGFNFSRLVRKIGSFLINFPFGRNEQICN